MKNKLNDLRNVMDESIFKERKFTNQNKDEVFRKVKHKHKKKNHTWLPQFLTVAFVISFLGLGSQLIYQEPIPQENLNSGNSSSSPEGTENISLNQEQDDATIVSKMNLKKDTVIEITEEFKGNLSIPLNLRESIPSVKAKPIITATSLEPGYRASVTYPMQSYEIVLIESLETSSRVAEELEKRHKIWEDEVEIDINGYKAFYSKNQKEMHIFTEQKYFTIFGAEETHLKEISKLIDFEKPIKPIETLELEYANMETVSLPEIKEENYIPSDFHEKIDFLKGNAEPLVLASMGEAGSSIRNHYLSPTSPLNFTIEQFYDESGKNKVAEQIIAQQDIVKTIETPEKTILLLSDGTYNTGYFAIGNYSFIVTGPIESIPLEVIQEILESIQVK